MDFHEDRRMGGGGERFTPGAGFGVDLHGKLPVGGAGNDVRQDQPMAARVQVALGENDLLPGRAGHLGVHFARMFQHFVVRPGRLSKRSAG